MTTGPEAKKTNKATATLNANRFFIIISPLAHLLELIFFPRSIRPSVIIRAVSIMGVGPVEIVRCGILVWVYASLLFSVRVYVALCAVIVKFIGIRRGPMMGLNIGSVAPEIPIDILVCIRIPGREDDKKEAQKQ
jgi:hypothetical protein